MNYYVANYIEPFHEFKFKFGRRHTKEVDAVRWWTIADLKCQATKRYQSQYNEFVMSLIDRVDQLGQTDQLGQAE